MINLTAEERQMPSSDRLFRIAYGSEAHQEEIEQMALALLASLTAEPVAVVNERASAHGRICWNKSGRDLPHRTPLYTAPPANSPVIPEGFVAIPVDLLSDYRDVKYAQIQNYKSIFGDRCDIPGSRWQLQVADLTDELAEIDKLFAAAPSTSANTGGDA
ncbi:Phage protein [Sodalis praecaptivus]|uniref:Phage protein n=1 Tax=Sodalis praecaptivus TaxID=1239307 RepID=W0HVT8_9GAMM|nr:hypothetical protein [Sodalis praecaptivus]AHF77946.1 Phage protein [Sodalis praecaptivus]